MISFVITAGDFPEVCKRLVERLMGVHMSREVGAGARFSLDRESVVVWTHDEECIACAFLAPEEAIKLCEEITEVAQAILSNPNRKPKPA